ncbi:MAG TPA: response regulator transcription factor [Anaerolineae bacterium]|nr:response regulator transcription factor [Anaerolineae bacterium]
MALIRVVLADDHAIVRRGIRSLLYKVPDIVVVGEAASGMQALQLAHELRPDVLVLDMEMPGLKGLDVARQLRAEDSPVRVLALSAYDDKQYILGLLANGAAGYLLKEDAPGILIDAVRGVARGEHNWISPRMTQRVAQWVHEAPQAQM